FSPCHRRRPSPMPPSRRRKDPSSTGSSITAGSTAATAGVGGAARKGGAATPVDATAIRRPRAGSGAAEITGSGQNKKRARRCAPEGRRGRQGGEDPGRSLGGSTVAG